MKQIEYICYFYQYTTVHIEISMNYYIIHRIIRHLISVMNNYNFTIIIATNVLKYDRYILLYYISKLLNLMVYICLIIQYL